MNIEKFVSQYDLKQIIELEFYDPQFCALSNVWQQIKFLPQDREFFVSNFLFLIIQNALISYQLSWKWEKWRDEFSIFLVDYFWYFSKINIEDNFQFRDYILGKCKNNCRLKKAKLDRIQKTLKYFSQLNNLKLLKNYYKDMNSLNEFLAQMMDQKKDAKTIVFAVKMFAYWARIVFDNIISYPFEISIPIDARLIKIYQISTWKFDVNNKEIKLFFENLSQKYNIPPLHLDTLLWLKYRNVFISSK